MELRPIEEVLNEHVDGLMSIRGVAGVGIGECSGAPCIKVFVVERNARVAAQIPDKLGGYEVAIEETGEFTAPRS